MEAEKTVLLPISHFSPSSLSLLLRNPLIWKLKYVFKIYDNKSSMSQMIGRAGHEALKIYYGGNPNVTAPTDAVLRRDYAIDFGMQFLVKTDDYGINYGKTGSREKMLKQYAQAMKFYFAEEPNYHKIINCEQEMRGDMKTFDGQTLPLPAVAIPDLIVEEVGGEIDIIDTKFKDNFNYINNENFIYIIQAQFLIHLFWITTGRKARRVLFREIKFTENSNDNEGKPQIQDWIVPADHTQYHVIFYNLYSDCVKFISNPDVVYLPNLSDNFDGEHAGLIYAQGLINSDMSDVEVMHKVRDVALVSKKFVVSRLDNVENKNLLPEEKIKIKFSEFGIPVEPEETKIGSSVTQYRFKVSAGVKMSTILKHKADIARVLEAKGDIRILAPIPGTSLIGIEIENALRATVRAQDTHLTPGTLNLPIGVDVLGNATILPLNEMPHLLIAGSTGSGKSILMHGLIKTLTQQLSPSQLKLFLIDPKRVELKNFVGLPHVVGGLIVEYEDALKTLLGLVDEMERRYKILEQAGKRDIGEYNTSRRADDKKLPYEVLIIDEFADLMMTSQIKISKAPAYRAKSKAWLMKKINLVKTLAKKGDYDADLTDVIAGAKITKESTKAEMVELLEEVDAHDELNRPDANIEMLIVRLAQMARAVGIHLIIATQSPRVDIISGLIKANFPTRIALTTSSFTESQIIIGQPGAEKLAGKGDLLIMSPALKGIQRLQGFMI